MACPYLNGNFDQSQDGVNEGAEKGKVLYGEYLQLDKILGAQHPVSAQEGNKMCHDEHLFIIIHQAYELWFKQIIFEIDSIRTIFLEQQVDEREMLVIIRRLTRITIILKLLADQFHILETMTPLDFMDFRDLLRPASGFQSLQFRELENKLGVTNTQRVKYNQQNYRDVFHDDSEIKRLDDTLATPSLLELVERWLERTPGLEKDGFNFFKKFIVNAKRWIHVDFETPAKEETDPVRRENKMEEAKKQTQTFESIFNEEVYNAEMKRGERRLSHLAFQGAIMICLYRDEPRFHAPFQMVHLLIDMDVLLNKWRNNHTMIVQRMIGSKLGTGGSSGYHYCRSTVSDRYKVFLDLFNISTYLIPRAFFPPLSSRMKTRLSISSTKAPNPEQHSESEEEEQTDETKRNDTKDEAKLIQGTSSPQ